MWQRLFAPAVFNGNQEDELLKQYFAGPQSGLTFVDVGGNYPETSISTPLERAGWVGVVIEPQPECAQALRAVRTSPIIEAACTSESLCTKNFATFYVSGPQSSLNAEFIAPRAKTDVTITVPLTTLNAVLKQHQLSKIDLLSLDTEGTEIDVMSGLDWPRYAPKMVLLEDHARDFSKHRYMRSKGYQLFRRTGYNSWYAQPSNVIPVSLWGWLQIFRKYVMGMPLRRWRRWRHQWALRG